MLGYEPEENPDTLSPCQGILALIAAATKLNLWGKLARAPVWTLNNNSCRKKTQGGASPSSTPTTLGML